MTNVAIIYSMYGHVDKLASSLQASVTPTLPIATPGLLEDPDGILLGIPTRFGMLPAQVKGLFDACGGLWTGGEIIGKPCGIFFSSNQVDLRS
ncbi:hypothetical protein PF006_g22514 [Phytophthora fragariae]|uniref:Flavodoxin-like domain-containing protein n=1 Tax=Phytophthora fragariae TaxID=53985 RepID=A0A6A3RX63_9STRA|nr:hypothetical protein PF003_g40454 [Phytophthora fragariae]KAE8925302.1 hypothetical protein PF009_g24487 [Phytophthora fragariae]KAE8979195.1 hypothetical protein PF011_g22946 [Phytophthora fragariae]KAE9102096.1 hypothetical protein PF006_g22514 [Phytophthora fragariae]KAE9293266.1 hypothetical protein PF008_g24850 [Phytophthora fragariae]